MCSNMVDKEHVLIYDSFYCTAVHRISLLQVATDLFYCWIQWNNTIVASLLPWFFNNSWLCVFLLTDEQTSDPVLFWHLSVVFKMYGIDHKYGGSVWNIKCICHLDALKISSLDVSISNQLRESSIYTIKFCSCTIVHVFCISDVWQISAGRPYCLITRWREAVKLQKCSAPF